MGSGCCGCPLGWCTSLLSSGGSSPPVAPPVAPFGLGGSGGAGGSGAGGATADAPLGIEPALPPAAAKRGKAKTHDLVHDKRAPIRGSLMVHGKGKTTFVPHAAKNAVPVGDGSKFVVAASTGLWLHDTQDLSKRNRLVSEPVLDVAASPDGTHIAYAFSDGRLRIVAYPQLASVLSVNVDMPVRMRFSSDGRRLALGSESDTVTLVEVTPSAIPKVLDTDEDVNDVYPMPDKPNEVAYASDDDEVVVVDMSASNRVFASEQLVLSWRNSKKNLHVMRDQLTVAFDSLTGTLLGGGDDNMFWRFSHLRTSPKVEDPIELGGNVVDIACCAGRTVADRAAFVAVDNAQVRAIGLDGRLGPTFGPLADSVISRPIRISLLPSGDVLVIPMSTLFRWEPRTGNVLQSNDYVSSLPMTNVVDADTIYVQCEADGCVVHRVEHGPKPVADIETTIAGELPAANLQTILSFASGLRAIVVSRGGKLQLAYLPVGGAPEPLLDTKVSAGGHFARKDFGTHGYVDPSGRVYEIAAAPRGMKEIGMAIGKGEVVGFAWDKTSSKWRIDFGEGQPVLVP